jgi:hypothetical protein
MRRAKFNTAKSRTNNMFLILVGWSSGPAVVPEVWAVDRGEYPPLAPRPSDRWHLDEMVISIRGGKYWLWRAVDNEGDPATLQARLVQLETEG